MARLRLPPRPTAILVLAAAGALVAIAVDRNGGDAARVPVHEEGLMVTRGESIAVYPPPPARAEPASLLTASDDPRAIRARLAVVGALAEEPGMENELASLALTDPAVAVREEALHALGERAEPICLQTLGLGIRDTDPRIRKMAIQTLAGMRGIEVELLLGQALGAADAATRLEAVDAIGALGPAAVQRNLSALSQDGDTLVREAVAEWLD